MKSRAKRYRGFPSQAAYRRAQKRMKKLDREEDEQTENEFTRPEPYVPKRVTEEELEWLRKVVRRYKKRTKSTIEC